MVTRAESSGLLGPKYRAASLALMSAVAMASYNNLSVTAALPDIGDDLGRVALLPWVVTVELVAAAIAVLAVGPYIDGAGARRAFRITVVAFLGTSAMCAAAPTMELLVLARVLQGLGSGALIGTALTSIGLVFDDAVRPWAYALMSSVWGIMGIGGPALAAVLVSTLGWRAVFAANLPVAVAAAAVGWSRLPATARAAAEPVDRRGLLLLSAFTVVLLVATSYLEWYSIVLVVVGVAVGALYVVHARSSRWPVVRLSHVTAGRWRYIHIVGVLAVSGGTGASVFLPLYLKAARGSSVAFAAFAVIWPTLGWSVAAWVSGKLQQHLRAQDGDRDRLVVHGGRSGLGHRGLRGRGTGTAAARLVHLRRLGHRHDQHVEPGAVAGSRRPSGNGQGELGAPLHPVPRIRLRSRRSRPRDVLGGRSPYG